ncbi:Uncharacterised protein [Mycobacteroides abscessus subsp. abscessus]|nr:Uncharacterised protein [Mycobacteroides abscessus subsp. abscessus]
MVRLPRICTTFCRLSAMRLSSVASCGSPRSTRVRKPPSILFTPSSTLDNSTVVDRRPGPASDTVPNTTRVLRIMLTVSGSTESTVLANKLAPSRIAASLRGPSLVTCNSLNILPSLSASSCASAPRLWSMMCGRVTGMLACLPEMTAPSVRYGPPPCSGRKSRYCSPAADKPETRTGLSVGMWADESTEATASTPLRVRLTAAT